MTVPRAVLLAVVLGLAVPVAASAGTVSRSGSTITVTGAPAGEGITFETDGSSHIVRTNQTFTSLTGCTPDGEKTALCSPLATLLVVNMQGGNDTVDGEDITDGAALRANGGGGDDSLDGTRNDDTLNGQDGIDTIWGFAGNDTLDGGAANDYLYDGPGNDTVRGGPGDDFLVAGPGADSYDGGDGADTIDYRERTAPVTITLLGGAADDGEAGEGDNIAANVESAYGGAGNDTIVGNDLGGYLIGGAGNDTITGGKGEDRVEGNEGDDIIDTRDGRYDSIDCGPGNDTLLADPSDFAENCEIAPDPDGDGWLAPEDCAPNDPAIHPGAGEIVGNNVDEDCKDGPLYLRVVAPVSYSVKSRTRPAAARFAKLVISEVKERDKVQITCKGGAKKGCAFAKKTITAKASTRRVDVAKLLKKRYLAKGVIVEIRLTRPLEIGRVQRFTVQARGKVKSELLCLNVGASKPAKCG